MYTFSKFVLLLFLIRTLNLIDACLTAFSFTGTCRWALDFDAKKVSNGLLGTSAKTVAISMSMLELWTYQLHCQFPTRSEELVTLFFGGVR